MEAARDYFLEPSATPRPHTCPSTPAAGVGSNSTAAAADGAPGSGQLQAALQAQQQSPPDAAGGAAADRMSGRGGQRLPGSTSARGNLMLKLGAEGGSDSDGCRGTSPLAGPSAGQGPSSGSQPVPISRAPAPAGSGSSAPPSDRQSFDSYESDIGSPWYYGSSPTASPAVPGFLAAAATGAAGAAARPGGGMNGSEGRRSWEEVAAGSTSAATAAAGAPPRPIVHVGSAPSPISLAGANAVFPFCPTQCA